MSILNKYFDKIYVINLDKRLDRLKEYSKLFNDYGIIAERISAIDGQPLDVNVHDKVLLERPGLVGCNLSHLKIIKIAKEKDFDNILIFEDDVDFDININEKFEKVIPFIPTNWDMLYLGGNNVVGETKLTQISESIFKTENTLATHSYAINKSIYDILIEELEKLDCPVDLMYSRRIQKTKQCYIIRPHLCWQRESYSDIMNGNRFYENLKL